MSARFVERGETIESTELGRAGALRGVTHSMICTMIRTMIAAANGTMDRAGRIVIPRDIRDQAGLEPGATLRISLNEGRIEIEPLPREVRIVRRGRLAVAYADEESEHLTVEQTHDALDALRGRGVK